MRVSVKNLGRPMGLMPAITLGISILIGCESSPERGDRETAAVPLSAVRTPPPASAGDESFEEFNARAEGPPSGAAEKSGESTMHPPARLVSAQGQGPEARPEPLPELPAPGSAPIKRATGGKSPWSQGKPLSPSPQKPTSRREDR